MKCKLLMPALAAVMGFALMLAGAGGAQPPPKKGPPFGKKGPARTISAEQIVERIMAFDKNNDNRITADELPERMQHLVALGDVNKDGALDREELHKLSTTLESLAGLMGGFPQEGGPPPGGPPAGPPPFPKGGPKGGALKAAVEVQRTMDDLDLSGPTRDRADRLVRAYQDKLRRSEEAARAELIAQLKEVLSGEDFRSLKSALDRPPGPPPFKGPRP